MNEDAESDLSADGASGIHLDKLDLKIHTVYDSSETLQSFYITIRCADSEAEEDAADVRLRRSWSYRVPCLELLPLERNQSGDPRIVASD